MKHLLFALLFIVSSASGQTVDYTVDRDLGTGYANRAYTFALGPDTLDASGGPDTLIIDFDQSFYGRIDFQSITVLDSLTSGGTTLAAGDIFIYESIGCATCPWKSTNDYSFPSVKFAGDYDYPFSAEISMSGSTPLASTKLRLVYIASAGKSALRTWLTLKPL